MMGKSPNIKRTISVLILLIAASYFFVAGQDVAAQLLDAGTKERLDQQTEAAQLNAGFTSSGADLEIIVGSVIKAFLGLLGIIFIILTVLAGYNWMTAYGDESKVEKAKNTLRTSIIGLVIIVAAYGITTFVLTRLLE